MRSRPYSNAGEYGYTALSGKRRIRFKHKSLILVWKKRQFFFFDWKVLKNKQKKSPVHMSRNLSLVSFLTSAPKPGIMTKRWVKEREMLNEKQEGRGKQGQLCRRRRKCARKKKKECQRETRRKEKHHPFSADTNTYSNKSSAIDFTARENLCSMRELFSATIHCDHPS